MKTIAGYEGLYSVTRDGRVWSFRSKKFLKSHLDRCGYRFVSLSKSGARGYPKVHVLVARAYIKRTAKTVNHKNGIKDDNRVANLEWMSMSQNIKHSFALGLSSQVGERNANAKLTDVLVRRIRHLVASGEAQRRVAVIVGISYPTVCNVVRRKTWGHVK